MPIALFFVGYARPVRAASLLALVRTGEIYASTNQGTSWTILANWTVDREPVRSRAPSRPWRWWNERPDDRGPSARPVFGSIPSADFPPPGGSKPVRRTARGPTGSEMGQGIRSPRTPKSWRARSFFLPHHEMQNGSARFCHAHHEIVVSPRVFSRLSTKCRIGPRGFAAPTTKSW